MLNKYLSFFIIFFINFESGEIGKISLLLAQRSPLEEVIDSKEYNDLKYKIIKQKDGLPVWVNQNGSYLKVFTEKKGIELIGDWLGSPKDFRIGDPLPVQLSDSVKYVRKFLYRETLLTLTVVLPVPTLVEAAQFKLVKDVLQFDAPALKIKNEENIPLNQNLNAALILYGVSRCGLRIRLPREGVMFISSKECSDTSLLTKLSDQLALKVLIERLSD